MRFWRTDSTRIEYPLAAIVSPRFGRRPSSANTASTEALSDYAYGPTDPAHPDAIAADRARPFHHREAFIRFRPYASHGSLRGRNPLAENWMDPAAQRG